LFADPEVGRDTLNQTISCTII